MKLFTRRVFLFLLIPIICVFLILEIILHNKPNSFNQKAKFLNENIENIEVLFLGSSHTQDGINPAYMTLKSANLGYGNQDYQMDSALISNYIEKMPNLKYVISEVDYIDFYKKREPDYFRYPWYEKYYGFKLGNYPIYKKWSLYLSNPDFFNNYIKNGLFNEQYINVYGFRDEEAKDKFYDLKYDSLKINKNEKFALEEIPFDSISKERYNANVSRLDFIESLAKKRRIIYIRVSFPMYKKYYEELGDSKSYKTWKDYLNKEKSKGKIVWDFEKNREFYVNEFSNPSHLNNKGAKKLTQFINDSIIKIENENP